MDNELTHVFQFTLNIVVQQIVIYSNFEGIEKANMDDCG